MNRSLSLPLKISTTVNIHYKNSSSQTLMWSAGHVSNAVVKAANIHIDRQAAGYIASVNPLRSVTIVSVIDSYSIDCQFAIIGSGPSQMAGLYNTAYRWRKWAKQPRSSLLYQMWLHVRQIQLSISQHVHQKWKRYYISVVRVRIGSGGLRINCIFFNKTAANITDILVDKGFDQTSTVFGSVIKFSRKAPIVGVPPPQIGVPPP